MPKRKVNPEQEAPEPVEINQVPSTETEVTAGDPVKLVISSDSTAPAQLPSAEHQELEGYRELLGWISKVNPRMVKILAAGEPFVVVKWDEPYFRDVYMMIRNRELTKQTWTTQDEKYFMDAIDQWKKRPY